MLKSKDTLWLWLGIGLLILTAVLLSAVPTHAAAGIFQSYISRNGTYYDADASTGAAPPIPDAQALWLDAATIAWNGAAGSSYKLLYDPDGDLIPAATATAACTFPTPTSPCYVNLTPSGSVSGYPANPNATGLPRLLTGLSAADAKHLLTGQTAVASYDGGGAQLDVSRTQIQSVLDALYATDALSATLGVTYQGLTPTVKLWAPTAQSVTLHRFADSTTPLSTTHPMTRDNSSGVWSLTGAPGWDRQFYLFNVQVYTPISNTVRHNLVTDPYAVSLSTDSRRSQFVNLADADLKPAGWDSLTKPTLDAFEDITVYEMHVRDFSINDGSILTPSLRGTYLALTLDGQNGRQLSDGMDHLLQLRDAGLSHVHLMPAFDIASVPEANVPRSVDPNPTGYARDSDQPQAIISATRRTDGFNWGYDPFHYGVPEGSYSTDPDGVTRILEFRQMVQTLTQNDLRVVLDVVYNHTAASGLYDKSVLDKVVPGYYHRYTTDGALYTDSCCDDTASEYAMFEKLMIDTLLRFATEYKIDGFRFDLMNFHTRQNMLNVQSAINAVDPDIYLYGEGWNFGSAQHKGFTTCPHCYAWQGNISGSGIGAFNDRLRDAAHGGYSQDSTEIRAQGFINGLSYDWNGYMYAERFQSDLHSAQNILRSSLRASGVDWAGEGNPYTDDPQESVPYVSKHDNETLYDQNVFKMPNGFNGTAVSNLGDRLRAQNMGLSLVGLAQGIPFFHMGSDILRSKSLDRNSYDSGDWFNRVYWDYSSNNFGVGLPPAWDNNGRWGIMGPHLTDTSLDPGLSTIQANAAHMRELLRLRYSSPLFRLRTEADVNNRVSFYNGGNSQDGFIVMGLSDAMEPDLDPSYESILVFFNADKQPRSIVIPGADNFTLHPVQADGIDADSLLQSATFDDSSNQFTIPARRTAVFVSATPISLPSDIDWVGLMWPRGGVSHPITKTATTADFNVYVQVYEPGVTDSPGQGAGIDCTLHWGAYDGGWSDIPMSYNVDIGNNDEYVGTIPGATLDGLPVGSYGFNAYCTDDGGVSKKWKQDATNIDGNPGTEFADDYDVGDGIISITPITDTAVAPSGGVFVHLFEWGWDDIAQECSYLAEKGYSAVQVSPPQEHIDRSEWWARYQPVSYDLFTRSGDSTDFFTMVAACNNVGIDVYADMVINHMAYSAGDMVGYAGTLYNGTTFNYPGVPFTSAHFHPPCDIDSYSNRQNVQECRLLGLPDLYYGYDETWQKIGNYFALLIAYGIDGFRIDAAKHIPAHNLGHLLEMLPTDYIFQEVIEDDPEPVRAYEYFRSGDVTEFQYANNLGVAFQEGCAGKLADLQTFGAGFLPSDFAVVFSNNHDNQRGHGSANPCIVTYQDGGLHDLSNIFMLAWPYGYPKVMSSYYFSDDDQGPPLTGVYSSTTPTGCNGNDWVCEHRRTAVANMVAFRAETANKAVTDWWDNGNDQIAFGRGDKGFVVINREGSDLTRTFDNSLPPGLYCDIIHGAMDASGTSCTGPTIAVDGNGRFTTTVSSMDGLALRASAGVFTPTLEITLLGSGDLQLSWPSNIGHCLFDIYRSSTPYLLGVAWQENITPPTTLQTSSNDPGNHFYVLRADRCGTAVAYDSNQVGEFEFDIQPGE